jgi:hypothetical protein
VDNNSLECGNPWEEVYIFEVKNLTKLSPEDTGSLGLATSYISTKSYIFHLRNLARIQSPDNYLMFLQAELTCW